MALSTAHGPPVVLWSAYFQLFKVTISIPSSLFVILKLAKPHPPSHLMTVPDISLRNRNKHVEIPSFNCHTPHLHGLPSVPSKGTICAPMKDHPLSARVLWISASVTSSVPFPPAAVSMYRGAYTSEESMP